MPIGINYNPGSARAAYDLNRSYQTMLRAMEKLSSGLRINRASDDPAGLVISERMRAQIASLNQEIDILKHYQGGNLQYGVHLSRLK